MQKILTSLTARAALLWLLGALLSVSALAQQPAPAKSPFGLAAPPAGQLAGPAAAAPTSRGVLGRGWGWLLETQARLNRDMAAAVRNLKSENPISAAATLIAVAFAYGVLHAAGPGHGKAVISSYVLANEETVRRGVALSFLAALFQALSAIAFVAVLAIVLRQTSIEMRAAEASIETISWALVAIVGAYLLWRQLAALWSRPAHAHAAHDHNHHNHEHGPSCSCGHSHMPAPKDLQGSTWSWREALPVALSVGIRPCTGALLLLIFALSQGMIWAGVLGALAMAFGTAITVSALAAMAVGSRNWAERASGPSSVWAGRIHSAAGVVGAGLVFLLGSAFFVASLNGAAPL